MEIEHSDFIIFAGKNDDRLYFVHIHKASSRSVFYVFKRDAHLVAPRWHDETPIVSIIVGLIAASVRPVVNTQCKRQFLTRFALHIEDQKSVIAPVRDQVSNLYPGTLSGGDFDSSIGTVG